MPLTLLLVFIAAFGLTIAIEALSWRLRWVDVPLARKFHSAPVPRSGGLAFLLVPVAAFAVIHLALPTYFGLALMIIYAGGLWDDLGRTDSAWVKLTFQCSACAVFTWGAGPSLALATGFGAWLGPAVIFFFLLFLTNAMNLMDNMNGLSAGLTLIAILVLTYLNSGNDWLSRLLLIEAACVFAFYLRNFPKATIFMGDQGSQLLGFLLASAFIYIVPGAFRGMPLHWLRSTAAAWIFFLPFVWDVTSVVVIRTREKRPLSVGDTSHLSHQLVKKYGLTPTRAVLCLKALQLASAVGVGAWVMSSR